jgi:Holliday junction resolvase RusA-like endonuclease
MTHISFTVPGEPRGKGRPRATRMGNNIRLYTDAKTAAYENLVALACQQVMQATGKTPLQGALGLSVIAYVGIPKSTSKSNRQSMIAALIRPAKKPDLDNIVKAVLDGLNGVAFPDDAQIVTIMAEKMYAPNEPCLLVSVSALGPPYDLS